MQADWQRYINDKYDKDYQWKTIAQGSSNTLFLGDDKVDTLIVRVNAAPHLTPGVSRAREAALLTLIANHKWSPAITENNVEQGWCAMKHYAPITDKTLSTKRQSQLIEALTELQSINIITPVETYLIDYENFWDTLYLPVAQRLNDQHAITWIEQIKTLLNTLPTIPMCLTHHDLHIGNLAVDKTTDTIILLDWEYGGLGNAWIDAAALKSQLNMPDHKIAELPAFRGLSAEAFKHGLAQATQLFDIIGKVWYWLRSQKEP